jgi:hypothetical protein
MNNTLEVPLYGGAAKCRIPTDWVDASKFRQIPDNQEVFVHKDGLHDLSTIIEILEYQNEVEDSSAGEFFFNDLANADGAIGSNIEVGAGKVMSISFLGKPARRVDVVGVQVKGKTGPNAVPESICVRMSAIRSLDFNADILITTHSTIAGVSIGRESHHGIVESIEFVDPHLFS